MLSTRHNGVCGFFETVDASNLVLCSFDVIAFVSLQVFVSCLCERSAY